MFKSDYKKELDSIVLTDDFKNATVQLLLEKSRELSPEADNISNKKTIFFPKKAVKNAVAACIILAVAIYGGFFNGKMETESADNAAESMVGHESEIDSRSKQNTDDLTVDGKHIYYTINDSSNLFNSPIQGAPIHREDNMEKIIFRHGTSGGMGFESYIVKSPSELEQNSAYTVGDRFDTLPVYRANSLDTHAIKNSLKKALEKYELQCGYFIYKWGRPVYHESGELMYNETIETTAAAAPDENCFLSEINADFTDKSGTTGTVKLHVGRSWFRVEYNKHFSDYYDDNSVINRFISENTGFMPNNYVSKRSFDYDIYGDIYDRTYLYRANDDYGVNLFNSTLGLTSFAQFEMPAKTTIVDEYLSDCWQIVAEPPAIDYKQALTLLYEGNYYSSSPVEITDETQVAHIEMTYLNSYYELRNERYTGYTLPFYKFYVDISDEHFPSRFDETGMRTYAAYYVCAVHPDYVEISEDDGYATFNN